MTKQKDDGKTIANLKARILKSSWWAKNRVDGTTSWGLLTRKGHDGKKTFTLNCADYDDSTSMLYGDAWPSLRLIHSFAHHLVEYDEDTQIHGPEFAKAYLAAVRRWLGQEAKTALAVSFAKHKVKTRTWSAEAKQAAKQRVALRELKALREELSK